MPPSVSSPLQIVEHDIRCPSLFSLEIQVEPAVSPVSEEAKAMAKGDAADGGEAETFDIYATFSVGPHWQALGSGQVQLAIAQAMLHLSVTHADFEPQLDSSSADTTSSDIVSFQLTAASHPPELGDAKAAATFAIAPAATATLAGTLSGQVQRVKLGQVRPSQPTWSLVAIAQTPPQQVCILDAEGLWRHDITPNKHGIVQRRLAFSLHESLLSPHLCRVQLCYQCPQPCPTTEINPVPLDAAALTGIIQDILDAPTSNLLALAQRAGLVVETDLARISLRGASLSGLDLSSVDLSYANLRGADLTDAELSETNLSYAKLGGADLSGADLGSANLSHADLHRASLALANLSGANLSGANLHDVNLSQTNLNGVQVHHAQFSDNVEINESLKASLGERGALFQ